MTAFITLHTTDQVPVHDLRIDTLLRPFELHDHFAKDQARFEARADIGSGTVRVDALAAEVAMNRGTFTIEDMAGERLTTYQCRSTGVRNGRALDHMPMLTIVDLSFAVTSKSVSTLTRMVAVRGTDIGSTGYLYGGKVWRNCLVPNQKSG